MNGNECKLTPPPQESLTSLTHDVDLRETLSSIFFRFWNEEPDATKIEGVYRNVELLCGDAGIKALQQLVVENITTLSSLVLEGDSVEYTTRLNNCRYTSNLVILAGYCGRDTPTENALQMLICSSEYPLAVAQYGLLGLAYLPRVDHQLGVPLDILVEALPKLANKIDTTPGLEVRDKMHRLETTLGMIENTGLTNSTDMFIITNLPDLPAWAAPVQTKYRKPFESAINLLY